MKDITNNINNVGKPFPERMFTLSFTGAELADLSAIVANAESHQHYPDTENLSKFIRDFAKMLKNANIDPFKRLSSDCPIIGCYEENCEHRP